MAKCSLTICEDKAVGGFQEAIHAGNFQDPHATIPGLKTLWCAKHEHLMRPQTLGKQGKMLKGKLLET